MQPWIDSDDTAILCPGMNNRASGWQVEAWQQQQPSNDGHAQQAGVDFQCHALRKGPAPVLRLKWTK